MAVNTGKIQGKHREFNLNLNVATLLLKVANLSAVFDQINQIPYKNQLWSDDHFFLKIKCGMGNLFCDHLHTLKFEQNSVGNF